MNRKERRAAGKRGAGGAPPTGPGALAGNLFAAAVSHFRTGALDAAERACRDVLTFDRNHAHALHLLGLIAYQSGRHDAALELIGRAFTLDSHNADCAFNMAQVLRAQGDAAQALELTRRALAQQETVELRALLVKCVRELGHSAIDGELRALIARALEEGWTRPSELSVLVGELCGHDEDLAALAEDQLLLALMRSAPFRTIAVEGVLTRARQQLLLSLPSTAMARAPVTSGAAGRISCIARRAQRCAM